MSKFIAGFNIVGFECDNLPYETSDFDRAKRYIINCLKNEESCVETEYQVETLCSFAEDINLESKPFEYLVLGKHYWIRELV